MALGAAAAPPPALPDELLEEIFLRLGDAADLARASTACASFRRIISERPFRRRFRSLHAPPVLGFVNSSGFHPAEPPHRSAAAGRALAGSADFTFSFLPGGPGRWIVKGARRDGLVLLFRGNDDDVFADDLVVCDPLHRRYIHVPQIPDDLAASVVERDWLRCSSLPILAPATSRADVDDDKKERETSPFSVICMMQSENKVVAFVFCSGNGEWQVIPYLSPKALPSTIFVGNRYGCRRSYAHGCFFWTVDSMCFSLVLDIREMKFSIIDLPPKPNYGSKSAIVDAGEGMLGLLTFDNSMVRLFRRVWSRNNDSVVGASECWQPYKTASFPKDSNGKYYHHWFITVAADDIGVLMIGCVILNSARCSWHYHMLELKTLILKRLCVSDAGVLSSHTYARFPPPLAPPCI
ncbi:unnamed protein product [Urochloa humidicola]